MRRPPVAAPVHGDGRRRRRPRASAPARRSRRRRPGRRRSALNTTRDEDRDRHEDQHQRPHRPRPLRRHAVARQVARHDVEQPGHRRGAGEPQDRDRRDVVDRAEGLAQVLVREIRQRAAVRRAAASRTRPAGSGSWWRGWRAAGSTLMISGGGGEQLAGVADPAGRASRTCPSASPLTCGITATPVSKPDMPSASFGKTSSATPTIASGEECSAVRRPSSRRPCPGR